MMRFNAAFLSDSVIIITEKAFYPIKMCGDQKLSKIFGVKKAIKKIKCLTHQAVFYAPAQQ